MKLISLLMLLFLSLAFSSQEAPKIAEKNAPSKIVITAKEEPGEHLTVSGVVFGADGKTPLANASVYVYQTDAKGLYTPDAKNDSRNPRLGL